MDLTVLHKAFSDHAAAVAAFQSKFDGDVTALGTRLDRIEAAGNRQNLGGGSAGGTVLEALTKSAGWAAVKSGQRSSGRIALPGTFAQIRKDLMSTQAGGSPNQGFNVQAQRSDVIGEDPRRALTLLDRLPSLPVTSNSFEYQTLDNYSSNAGYQSTEGATKPETQVPLTLLSAPICTIAHTVRCSEQILSDAPMLQNYLQGLMTHGIRAKAESELVAGATAGRIAGLLGGATLFAPTATKAADKMSEALASLEILGYTGGLVILHPTDWHTIRSERDSQQSYVTSGWQQPPSPTIWSTPVVTTPSLTQGNAIVLDPVGPLVLDRQAATVEVGLNGDDFSQNMVTMRAEIRIGLAIFSNGAILKFPI